MSIVGNLQTAVSSDVTGVESAIFGTATNTITGSNTAAANGVAASTPSWLLPAVIVGVIIFGLGKLFKFF